MRPPSLFSQPLPHLPIERENVHLPRRTRSYYPPARDDRDRERTAEEFMAAVGRIENNVAQRPSLPAGVEPHLVFRLPLVDLSMSPKELAAKLEDIGLTVVSIE